jgi:DNA-directed RNA polymerase specialized sigma24 family protein
VNTRSDTNATEGTQRPGRRRHRAAASAAAGAARTSPPPITWPQAPGSTPTTPPARPPTVHSLLTTGPEPLAPDLVTHGPAESGPVVAGPVASGAGGGATVDAGLEGSVRGGSGPMAAGRGPLGPGGPVSYRAAMGSGPVVAGAAGGAGGDGGLGGFAPGGSGPVPAGRGPLGTGGPVSYRAATGARSGDGRTVDAGHRGAFPGGPGSGAGTGARTPDGGRGAAGAKHGRARAGGSRRAARARGRQTRQTAAGGEQPEPGARTRRAPAGPRASRRDEPGRAHARGNPPAPYQPYLDGLFTYCLSVLGEHGAATDALAGTLVLAERHHARLRDHRMLRAWLYALARHCCLERLSASPDREAPAVSAGVARRRRADLAALAWPEAEGTDPAQREALELAVRHGLAPQELAAVLGLEPARARDLLSRAACEVERGRAALATVDASDCPDLGGLAGNPRALGPDLRRALVRHVEECPRCGSVAELAPASGPGEPDVLAVVPAPRAPLPGEGPARTLAPRFDRRGFPVGEERRAARRSALLRHRAVTTTVVVAVVAAPVLALWAAHGGGHHEPAADGAGVSAGERGHGGHAHGAGGEAADGTGGTDQAAADAPGGRAGSSGTTRAHARHHTAGPREDRGPSPSARPGDGPSPVRPGPGRLTLTAHQQGRDTVVTLTNPGGSRLRWHATAQAAWLLPSRTSGTLAPGESATVVISVDNAAQPSGTWSGRVVFAPSGAAVTVEGAGPTPDPSPSPTPSPDP